MQKTNFCKIRKRKPRIITKGKSYLLKDSALYKITTKKRLAKCLQTSLISLEKHIKNPPYRVFKLPKTINEFREIQAPLGELDFIHTRIASLLSRIQVPDYLHSGIKGRSNITNAKMHIGNHPVLTMDIRAFYPSVSKKSIYNFFNRYMMAMPDVAGMYAELCSYQGHIPTGSRISMPLAFWTNYKMFENMSAYCQKHGIVMSVYVDDLTFSGLAVNEKAKYDITKIITCSGHAINEAKSKLYKHNAPKMITGVIVTDNNIKVRNKHHKSIYDLFKYFDSKVHINEAEFKSLIGKLHAAGQIEDKFKQRAKSLRTSELLATQDN